MFKLTALVFISAISMFFVSSSMADDHSNARGKGMGNSTTVSGAGVDAYGINPANFIFSKKYDFSKKQMRYPEKYQKPTWEVSFLSVGGQYGSDESLSFYNNYIKYLSINRQTFTGIFTDLSSVLYFRQNVLPEERTQVNYDLEVKWISVNYFNPKFGAINFSIADKIGLNTDSYSRDEEMPLGFRINSYDGKYDLQNVNINQAEASAWWIRKYNISFAKQFSFAPSSIFRNVAFGVSLGLVHGFGNIITYDTKLNISTFGIIKDPVTGYNHVDSVQGKQDFHSRTSLTDFFQDYRDGAQSHYFSIFPRPAGKGYSIDLGFNLQIGNSWHVAASVTDVGKILWDYNTTVNDDTNHLAYYNFLMSAADPTYNMFINDLDGIDTRYVNQAYKTELPTKYRAGVMYRPNNELMIEAGWVKGINNLPGNSIKNIFSAGAEYFATEFLPLRAGINAGGPGGFYLSVGAGIQLGNMTLDFAAGGVNHIVMNKRLNLSLSTKLIL